MWEADLHSAHPRVKLNPPPPGLQLWLLSTLRPPWATVWSADSSVVLLRLDLPLPLSEEAEMSEHLSLQCKACGVSSGVHWVTCWFLYWPWSPFPSQQLHQLFNQQKCYKSLVASAGKVIWIENTVIVYLIWIKSVIKVYFSPCANILSNRTEQRGYFWQDVPLCLFFFLYNNKTDPINYLLKLICIILFCERSAVPLNKVLDCFAHRYSKCFQTAEQRALNEIRCLVLTHESVLLTFRNWLLYRKSRAAAHLVSRTFQKGN